MAFLRGGNRSQAMDCFQKCIDITPEMALRLIESCQEANIDYVVAPYEADAQLAFLCKAGLCDAVITEDSDLLVFGYVWRGILRGILLLRSRLVSRLVWNDFTHEDLAIPFFFFFSPLLFLTN